MITSFAAIIITAAVALANDLELGTCDAPLTLSQSVLSAPQLLQKPR